MTWAELVAFGAGVLTGVWACIPALVSWRQAVDELEDVGATLYSALRWGGNDEA